MFALPRGVDGGTAGARQAFDLGRIVEEDGALGDGLYHCPVVVVALQAEDNGAPRRAVQKIPHGFPECGQVWVGDAAPGDFHVGDALLAHHLVEDRQHLGVDDAADQQFSQQPAPREEVDQVVEELLRLLVGRTVDDAFGVDNAVESA